MKLFPGKQFGLGVDDHWVTFISKASPFTVALQFNTVPCLLYCQISKTMLQKGWRCLDCTVCEGCGKPHDESRLILCDECDISFHIYCLDPPLDEVPQGAWKCKWCIVCLTCGATSPGVVDGCAWQNNYSQCARCASLEMCPACSTSYTDGELILQCAHCERFVWSLSVCFKEVYC